MKIVTAVPLWLKPGVDIPDTEMPRLEAIGRSWQTVFAARMKLTELDCLRLFCLELQGAKRAIILNRLRWYHNKLRTNRERDELWAKHPGAGVKRYSKGRKEYQP